MTNLPARLERPPLVEAVVEVRFKPSEKPVAELMPGMLYGEFSKSGFKSPSVTPLNALPREARRTNPDLAYVPLFKLEGETGSIMVGDQMIAVSKMEPYEGWDKFRELCLSVLEFVHGTGLFGDVVRVSMKCVNLVPATDPNPLWMLNGTLTLNAFSVAKEGLHLRAQLHRPPFISVLEIASEGSLQVRSGPRVGAMVNVDAILPTTPTDFWGRIPEVLDSVHGEAKALFFGALAPTLIASFKPEGSDVRNSDAKR